MNQQTKLILGRGIFFLIIFVCLGVIVVTEKASGLLVPKVKDKMIDYLNTNYDSIKDQVTTEDPIYENMKYTMKVTSKKNENYYFYLYYQNKTITDSYQKDYVQGNTLLKKIKKDLEIQINEKTDQTCTVLIPSSLDDYTSIVQERIIKQENLLELKFYNIRKEFTIKNWKEEEIVKEIVDLIETNKKNDITPKNYIIQITNQQDITESFQINLTEEFLEIEEKQEIIHDIINNENTDLLKQYKIKYKALN